MTKSVRRVVTGHTAAGKAVVLADGEPPLVIRPPLQPGLAFHEIWNTTEMPQTVTAAFDEPTVKHSGTAPPKRGTVIRIVDLPPEGPDGPQFDKDQSRELFSAVGLAENAERHKPGRHPLMHRTESIDYGIVLSGEIVMLLDDSEVLLKTGDVVVQRGTVHAWTNRTREICRMAFILTDGAFEPGLAQRLAEHDSRLAAE
jgi:mannose-6-phosphate isomerase-like protein (cupin superfamily)